MTRVLAAVVREVPLTPDSGEAREWAERELSKAIYSDGPSLWERFLDWLSDLWMRITEANGVLGPVLLPVIVLAVIAALVIAALLLGGPIRRRRLRRGTASFEVLDGDERDARALRASADAAAAAGDHALAVLERFRAIVRSLDERTILEDRPGRTALEAATAAGARLPGCADDLHRAADLFDEVCYGSAHPGAEEDAWLRAVDERVARTKPERSTRPERTDAWTAAR